MFCSEHTQISHYIWWQQYNYYCITSWTFIVHWEIAFFLYNFLYRKKFNPCQQKLHHCSSKPLFSVFISYLSTCCLLGTAKCSMKCSRNKKVPGNPLMHLLLAIVKNGCAIKHKKFMKFSLLQKTLDHSVSYMFISIKQWRKTFFYYTLKS